MTLLLLGLSTAGVADAASAAFYAVGALAVVVGGAIAVRRFGLEQPYGAVWEIAASDCDARSFETRSHLYVVRVRVWNRSRSQQFPTRCWIRAVLPGEEPPRLDESSHPRSVQEVSEYFKSDGQSAPLDSLGPGESFLVQAIAVSEELHQAVGTNFALEFKRRRLWGWGVHRDPGLRFAGWQALVRVEDLRFLREP